jgi:solute carrier family 25 citrate transporter 1
MLKQSTNQATRFLVFGELKKLYQRGDPTVTLPVWASAISGALAGAASVFVNNPIDVIKTKMQGLEAAQYKNSFHCAKEIFVKQGPLFFYSGAVPRLTRVCGDAAIVFTVYERLVDFFTDMEKKFFK